MLVESVSDPMARRVTMLLDIAHLREWGRVPEDVRWRLTMDDAVVLLARTWEYWPGPGPDQRGLSREEESAVVAEYQAKGRTVSLGWSDFERAANSNSIWLKDANLREGDSAVVLSGYGHEEVTDRYLEFEVTGSALRWERTDTGATSLDELLRLGEASWDDFARRRPRSTD